MIDGRPRDNAETMLIWLRLLWKQPGGGEAGAGRCLFGDWLQLYGRRRGLDDDDTRLCSIKSPANCGITARLGRNPCVSLTNSCLLGCREGYEAVEVAFDRCIVAFGVSKMTGL